MDLCDWNQLPRDRVGQHLRPGTGQITQLKLLQPRIRHQLLFLLPSQFWREKRMGLCSVLAQLCSSGAEVCLWIWSGTGCTGHGPEPGECCPCSADSPGLLKSSFPSFTSAESSPHCLCNSSSEHWHHCASQRATKAQAPSSALPGHPKSVNSFPGDAFATGALIAVVRSN